MRAAATSRGWTTRSRTRSTWPVPWIIRTASFSASAGRPAKRRLARGSSRTSRRRSPARRRRSRSAAAAARHAALPSGTRTPRHGVTTSSRRSPGPRGAATRSGSRHAVGRRDVLAARHGAVRQRRCRLPRCAGRVRRPVRLAPAARRRATARPARRRAPAGTPAPAPTSAPARSDERDHRAPRPRADPQLAGLGVEGDQAEVERAVDQVAAPVVEHEQEPPGQPRELRVAHSRASRSAATGRRSARPPASPVCGETITLRTSSCVARRQQPGRRDRVDHLRAERAVGRPAGRAAGGWPGRSGARRRRRTPRRRRDSGQRGDAGTPAADQPEPDERAVVGGPGSEHAGAAVPASRG